MDFRDPLGHPAVMVEMELREQGSPGKTGPQGATGAKGMKGECCITGPVGPKGDRRKKGDSGIQAGPHNMCSA